MRGSTRRLALALLLWATACGTSKAGSTGAGPGSTSAASGTTTGSSGTTGGSSTGASTSSGGTTSSSSSGSGTTGSSSGSSGSGGSIGTTGGQGCAPGHYDLDGDASNGCEVTCASGVCVGPDGGALTLDAPPPYSTAAQWSVAGQFVPSAQLSEPMTSAHFTQVGHLLPLGAPAPTPTMTSAHFQIEASFLGSVR